MHQPHNLIPLHTHWDGYNERQTLTHVEKDKVPVGTENSPSVPQKVKNRAAIRPSNATRRRAPKRNENKSTHNLNTDVPIITVHNSQEVETARMSFNEWMDKYNCGLSVQSDVIWPYKGMMEKETAVHSSMLAWKIPWAGLRSMRSQSQADWAQHGIKARSTNTRSTVDESRMHRTDWAKPVTGHHARCASIYRKCPAYEVCRDAKQTGACLELIVRPDGGVRWVGGWRGSFEGW